MRDASAREARVYGIVERRLPGVARREAATRLAESVDFDPAAAASRFAGQLAGLLAADLAAQLAAELRPPDAA